MKRLPVTGMAHSLPVFAYAVHCLFYDLTRNYRRNH